MEEYHNPPNRDLFANSQQALPNATTVLVLGILSIVVCFVCGIIALIIASGDRKLYQDNPSMYTIASYDLVKAGRICSIISLCLWGVGIIFYAFIFIFLFSTSQQWR